MNEKKSAKLKSLVVAFVLIFAGFAALVAMPGSVIAEEPTVTTEPADLVEANEAELNMTFSMGDIEEVTVYFNWTDDGWDSYDNTDAETYDDPANDTYHAELLTGLAPDTEHRFVAVLEYHDEDLNDTVRIEGDEEVFTTGAGVTIDGPTAVHAGEENTWYANVTGTAVDYNWTLVDDHVGDEDSYTHTFDTVGPRALALEIEDDSGYIVSYDIVIDVQTEVTVTVVDEDMEPIEDAHVFLRDEIEPALGFDAAEFTDENGTAVFNVFSVTGVVLEIEPEDMNYSTSVSIQGYIGKTDYFTGPEHTVILEERTNWTINVGPVLYEEEIDGVIHEIPVDEALLNVTWDGGYAVGETDASGHFEFMVEFSPYDTEFTVDIFHPEFNTKETTFVGLESYEIFLTDELMHLFTFGPLVDQDGDPLEDYRVSVETEVQVDILYEELEKEVYYDYSATDYTDEDGMIDFYIVNPFFDPEAEVFEVRVRKDDWVGHPFNMGPGQIREIGDDIVVTWFEMGPVIDADGEPIEDVRVEIEGPLDFGEWSRVSHTDADGMTDTFKVVHFNPYHHEPDEFEDERPYVSVSHPDYRSRVLTAAPGDNITMEVKPVVSIGPVIDRGGRAVRNAYVTLERQDDDKHLGSGYTDADGMFYVSVDFNPVGTPFNATISHEDLEEDEVFQFTGAESPTFRIMVGEPQTIRVGPIRDNLNALVAGATVELWYDGDMIGTVTTDTSGIAEFEFGYDPADRTFTFVISHPELEEDKEGTFTGETSGPLHIDIGEPEPVEKEFTITVGPIRDVNRKSVDDATVTLSWNNEELTQTTDAQGRARFTVTLVDREPADVTFTYTVSHDDLEEDKTGTFSGENSGALQYDDIGEEDDEPISAAMLGGIAALIIIIIIIIVVMMMKKKPAVGPEDEVLEEEFPEEEEPLFEEEEEEDIFEEEDLFEEEEEEDLFEEEEDIFEEEEPAFEEEEEDLFEEEEEEF